MNTWYTIRNGINNTGITEIYIDNEIGDFGIPARTFLNELKAAGNNPVNLHINSPGGSLIDAFAIYDFIKLKGYKVHAYIHGIAASAATIVSSAAQQTYIGEHSYFFIHNPFFSQAKGGAESDLAKMKNDILDIYMRKTGLDRQTLSDMMDKETLLNATEALDLGFVDGIAKEAKVAALQRRQQSLEKLTTATGKNIVLHNDRLDPALSNTAINKLINTIWVKMSEIDRRIKYKLRTASPIDSLNKPDSISSIKNNNPMPNTQDLQTQLEGLVQQLNDLLQQYFTQDGAQPAGTDPNAPAAKPGDAPAAKNTLQQKDETIQSLKQELARYKARKVDNKTNPGDQDPDGADAAQRKGWNYVSNYLQNNFR